MRQAAPTRWYGRPEVIVPEKIGGVIAVDGVRVGMLICVTGSDLKVIAPVWFAESRTSIARF
jgi:hypothetical protein